MGKWDAVRAKAIAAIKDNGRLCRIVVVTEGTPPDLEKPWNVPEGTPTYYPSGAGGKFAVADLSMGTGLTEEGYPQKNIIVPGDVGVDIDMTMTVEILEGVDVGMYRIRTLNTYAPDGLTRIGTKLRCEAWRT